MYYDTNTITIEIEYNTANTQYITNDHKMFQCDMFKIIVCENLQ